MQSELDLLGDPIDPGHGQRGRPRHMPTDALRRKVRALKVKGLSQVGIAAAIGITEPTLRLNYPVELESMSQVWRRRSDL